MTSQHPVQDEAGVEPGNAADAPGIAAGTATITPSTATGTPSGTPSGATGTATGTPGDAPFEPDDMEGVPSGYAVVFAGGRGERMNSRTVPKQFLELHGKPIIVYTLELFDRHPLIRGIVVVILDGWQDRLRKLIDKFQVEKVVGIVPGGATGQESIYNGLAELARHAPSDAPVLIHDGVRPLIRPETITDNLRSVGQNGSAITVTPATETIFLEDDRGHFGRMVDRSRARMARAPQSFVLADILAAHEKARAQGRSDFVDSATLMRNYGATLHLVDGPVENIKITRASDFYVFRAIMDALESQQLFGM